MKKFFAIPLILIFSVTALLSGALGYSDCAMKCAYETAKAHQHTSMGSMGLVAPNCCSGTMKNGCEMTGAPQVKIPECSMPSYPNSIPNLKGVGFMSGNIQTDISGVTLAGLQLNTSQPNKTPPIYLQTLSILC